MSDDELVAGLKATQHHLRTRAQAAEAERDRLRERAIAAQEEAGRILELVAPGSPGVNSGGELVDLVAGVVVERDRLRAAFEGVQALLDERTDRWALAIAERDTAMAERDRLRVKAEEADVELTEFVNLITPLLHGTANALKGEPGPLHMHDWSDLPKVAADLVAERDRLRESVARYKAFAESEILDRVSADLGVDLRRQLEKET